jgi:hypothetical protein
MKKMINFDEIVNYDLVCENYTVKIFKNKFGEFYSQIVYEDDVTSEMIYQSDNFSDCNSAKQNSLKFIESNLE